MSVLLVTADLACASSVAGAAARVGVELQTALSLEAMEQKLTEAKPRLVILDLAMRTCQPAVVVPKLRERLPPTAKILAFGSHVHTGLLAAAREAGCDQVVSRGEFHARLDDYLRQPA